MKRETFGAIDGGTYVYTLTWNDWPRDSHRSDVVHNLSRKTRNSHTSVKM